MKSTGKKILLEYLYLNSQCESKITIVVRKNCFLKQFYCYNNFYTNLPVFPVFPKNYRWKALLPR